METCWQDLRFSMRTLGKAPGFTAVAVLSLALGIGANTIIFTLIHSVFLNPLPVEKASELVAVFTTDENNPGLFSNLHQVSHPNYEDFREQNEVFSGLAAYSFPMPISLRIGEEPEQIFTEVITGNYFDVLGIKPALGRFFHPDEDQTEGTHPVIVMSHGLWSRRFGNDPAVVGRVLTLNGHGFTVVGIAPDGFKGVNAIGGPELWVPTMMHQQVLPQRLRDWFADRRALFFSVAGRLESGITMEQAEANLKTIAGRLEKEYPEPNNGRNTALLPLAQATIFPGIRSFLVLGGAVLMTVVGLVLLIACSNVANLLLARAMIRKKEIAIRLSMGARRGRLVRQFLTESTLLGLAGGFVGLLVAYLGRELFWSIRPPFLPGNMQDFLDLTMDFQVLGFTLVVSLITGVLFGLVPSLQASKPDVVEALKEETKTAGRSRHQLLSLRSALVVGQVALCIVSLMAAGLFLRSLGSAHEIDPGFDTETLAVLMMSPGQRGYKEARANQFYREIKERVQALPGIHSVSLAANLPLFGGFQRSVFIEGQESSDPQAGIITLTNIIDLDYFETMGIEILRGRDFTSADRENSVPVAIINETMAEQFWPGQDPVGKRFRFYGDDFYRLVIGIARASKYVTLGEDPRSCAYMPLRQNFSDSMVLYVRSESDPAIALGAAQREVRAIDPQLPVMFSLTISEVIDQSLWGSKLGAILLAIMGGLALALAAVGLYGLIAYSVNQRNQEIGIRMALGARQIDVITLILRQGMTLVGVGIALGLTASLAVSRLASALLYGISPTDPTTYVGVSMTLLVVALIASFVPAFRASHVDPLDALRHQ